MHILTDAGADLTVAQRKGLTIHTVPLVFTLDGRVYRSGIDIQPAEFYELLAATRSFPSTSQPAPGDFAAAYRRLIAGGDRDVLSIHISSGLSGAINAARLGAQETPEANVTFVDTLTLSAAQGWQVEAAGRMIQAGWPLDRILPALERIREATETFYTLETLRYLEHGGRISHIRALLGQILDLKPIIGVNKTDGKYAMQGRERSLKRAIQRLADIVAERFEGAGRLRVQVMQAHNPAGAQQLVALVAERFDAHLLPVGDIAPVLGAHTGPGLVGICAAPLSAFDGIPGLA
ncbi:MAG: DegV domain-containing protein [Chloroflexi bacterium ADurb.Bin325]|nr:MAG: DegV domain-containing protein [Chloroflexi bacterium ADurb.Bin325]